MGFFLIIIIQWQEMPAAEKTVYYTHRAQRKSQATAGSRMEHTVTRWDRRQGERAGSRSKAFELWLLGGAMGRAGEAGWERAGVNDDGRLQKHKGGSFGQVPGSGVVPAGDTGLELEPQEAV